MNTTSPQTIITLSRVSKHFSSGGALIKAVKNVNLTIKKGELLAIIGPSGSGKTTLSHILGGIAVPSEGTVMYKNNVLTGMKDHELSFFRNHVVGFVFQNFSLLPYLTADENVSLPLAVRGISPGRRRVRARKLLTELGLKDKATQRVGQLSGGQKQRVAIARALIGEPEVLIADEPTGNLDSINSEEVMTLLENIVRKKHLTVVMVTHNSDLAKRADRIIHIRDGIVTEVPHARA